MDDDGLAAKMGEIEALALAEIETFLSTENASHELKDSEIKITRLFSKYRSLIRDLETLVDELEECVSFLLFEASVQLVPCALAKSYGNLSKCHVHNWMFFAQIYRYDE